MEYSIKTKNADGSSSISMGNLYYDKIIDQLIYVNKYPENTIWIIKDTLIYQIKNNRIIDKQKNITLNKLSIFYLAMNGNLNDFGLSESSFSVKEVKKESNSVITTWIPPDYYKFMISKIMIRNIANQLDAVAILDKDELVVSKQFFRKYLLFDGLAFPTEMIQITFDQNHNENYQLTNFRNIKVNDFQENFLYFSPLLH